MNKGLWTAAGAAALVSIDLYFGSRRHKKAAGRYEAPVSSQGKPEFFMDGDKLFRHMLHQIYHAEKQIHMHFYIFRDDETGVQFLQALIYKAAQGLDVKLMLDWIGHEISPKTRRILKKSKVQLTYVQKPKLPYVLYSINQRNHRKVTIIDGKHAYIGGFNVGNEYRANDPDLGTWRDYHLYIQGDIVHAFSQQFARDWEKSTQEKLEIPAPSNPLPEQVPMQLISTDGVHLINHLKQLFADAEHSVFIGTPYYVPGREMHQEVLNLAKRGVKVQLLIPEEPDLPLLKQAAYIYMRDLLDAGVDVRRYNRGFYHAKVLLIDNKRLDVSSANFDMRSFYINHESNCTIEESEWVSRMSIKIAYDFYICSEKVTYELLDNLTLWDRTRRSAAKIIAPLL